MCIRDRRTTALAQAALAAQDAYRQSCMDGFNSQAQQAFAHRQLAGVSKVMHTLAKDLSDAPWPKEGAGATLVRQLEKEGFPAKSALVYSHRSCLRAEVKLHRRKKPAYYEGQLENAVSAALNKQMRLLFSQTEAALDVYDFEEVNKEMFPTLEEFKNALTNFDYENEKISVQKDEIVYPIDQEVLDKINDQYDNINLLDVIGGLIHQKPEDKRYREQKCVEIYGRSI